MRTIKSTTVKTTRCRGNWGPWGFDEKMQTEVAWTHRTKWQFIFNKIAIQAGAHMAADKEAVGLSRVHVYESKYIPPLRDNCLLCSYTLSY